MKQHLITVVWMLPQGLESLNSAGTNEECLIRKWFHTAGIWTMNSKNQCLNQSKPLRSGWLIELSKFNYFQNSIIEHKTLGKDLFILANQTSRNDFPAAKLFIYNWNFQATKKTIGLRELAVKELRKGVPVLKSRDFTFNTNHI